MPSFFIADYATLHYFQRNTEADNPNTTTGLSAFVKIEYK